MKKQIILSSLFAFTMQADEQMVITALELAAELPEKSQQDEAENMHQEQTDSLTKKNQAQGIRGAFRRFKEKELAEKIARDEQLLAEAQMLAREAIEKEQDFERAEKQAQEAQLLSGSNTINADELLDRETILLERAQEMADIQNRWNDPDYDKNINESF